MRPTRNATSGSPAEAWRVVHERLRSIAQSRAALDAEEVLLLRQAGEIKLWRYLGYGSAADYLECELGYAPRTAMERLRVAETLCVLPKIADALAAKHIQYTSVRDLSRIATPVTEADWLAHARGKTVREVRDLVRGHRYGDRPDDGSEPTRARRRRTFALKPGTIALLREVRLQLEKERGDCMDDDELIEALCRRALEPMTRAAQRNVGPTTAVIKDDGGPATLVLVRDAEPDKSEHPAEREREADVSHRSAAELVQSSNGPRKKRLDTPNEGRARAKQPGRVPRRTAKAVKRTLRSKNLRTRPATIAAKRSPVRFRGGAPGNRR